MSRFKLASFIISTCVFVLLVHNKYLTNRGDEIKGEFSIGEISEGEAGYGRHRRSTQDEEKSDKNEIIDQTLALLEEGNKNIITSNNSDVVLMVGNTGSGKSTITLFLTSDNSKLEAYEADSDTVLIRDHFNRISTSTIVSKTIFPELMTDEETNTTFYDCPGFSDTRNSTVEIVNSVFTKEIADKAVRVKIILIVNHSSVKSGGDRRDFMVLVKHTLAFLRNIDTFRPAVALLATKVMSPRSDARIIMGIAEFVTKAKSSLNQVLDGDTLVAAHKLFETLLEQNEAGEYTRITFFRQPNDPGPLSENEEVQDRKLHMKRVIWNNIKFVLKSENDFGFPLSDKALNDVRTLTDAINDRIYDYFKSLGGELTDFYKKQFIQSKKHLDLPNLKVELEKLSELFNYLRGMDLNLNQNEHFSTNDYLNDVVAKIRATTVTSTSEDILKGIVSNTKYLGFLSGLTSNSVSTSSMKSRSSIQLNRWLEPLNTFKQSTKSEIDSFYDYIDNRILSIINRASGNLKNYYEEAFSQSINLTTTQFDIELKHLLSSLSKIDLFCLQDKGKSNDQNNSSVSEFANTTQSEFVHQLITLFNNLERQESILGPSLQAELVTAAEYLDFAKAYQERNPHINDQDVTSSENELENQSMKSMKEIKKSLWLSELRLVVSQIKSNYVDLEATIHTRIILTVTNLANHDLTLHYALQFQSLENIQNFKERLDSDLLWMKKTLDGVDPNPVITPGKVTHSKLVYDTIKKFLTPMSQSIVFQKSLQLQQLQQEGSFLDTLQEYSTFSIKPQPSKWFFPLIQFVQTLDSTVNEPISCGYNPGYEFDPDLKLDKNLIIAKGTFVSLNETLIKCFYNQDKSVNKPLGRHKKNILILSKHTIYIDTDLDTKLNPKLTDLNIVILSPNWVAQKKTKLSLNGLPGKSYNPKKAGSSATTGYGESGKPGLPGENAGNFLLVGRNFGGETVTISADGGEGGKGQEGGDGLKGTDGEEINLDKIQYSVDQQRYISGNAWQAQIRIASNNHYTYSIGSHGCYNGAHSYPKERPIYACQDFTFTGLEAKGGKPGGSGGKGGIGGNNGLINLFGPHGFKNAFITTSKSGAFGSGSSGGKGGLGGKHGNRMTVNINPTRRNSNGGKFKSGSPSLPWGAKASNGADGVTNLNEVNRQSPLSPDYESALLIQSNSINVFRNYARNHSENAFHKKGLLDFLAFLDDNEDLRQSKVSTILSIIQEFQDLETQYFWFKDRISFTHFYQQFLKKIQVLMQLSESQQRGTANTENESVKKALKYLFTAAYARTNSFNPRYDTNLITDMVTYLDLTKEQLEKHAKESISLSALSLIRKVKQDYNQQIQEKFQEANNFISHEITPEIHRIQENMDRSVNKLLDEIEDLKKQEHEQLLALKALEDILEKNQDGLSVQALAQKRMAEDKLAEVQKLLDKKRKQLKTKTILNFVFSGAKIIGGLVSSLGPIGAAVGAGLGMAATAGEKIMGHTGTGKVTKEQVEALQNDVNSRILKSNIDHLSFFDDLLSKARDKLQDEPLQFQNVIIVINRQKIETQDETTRLQFAAQENKFPTSASASKVFIQGKKSELENLLHVSQQGILNVSLTRYENQTESELEIERQKQQQMFKKITSIQRLLRMPLKVYIQVRENIEKAEEISQAIEDSQDKISDLNNFMDKVSTDMISLLQESRHDLNLVLVNLASENKTGSALDVTRWKAATKLRDMKIIIRKNFTSEYEIDEDMARLFEKLEEGLITLIQIYERMDHLQEQSKLASYITDINAVQFQNVKILDPVLSEKIGYLERIILSTTILGQCELILNSLKMGAFPFADFYLGTIKMPISLTRPGGTSFKKSANGEHSAPAAVNLVLDAVALIEQIRAKVITMKSTHKELDTYLFFNEFDTSSPFYVWKNNDDHEPHLPQKLLLGNNILARADILKSPSMYNAVKFSKIELKFAFTTSKSELLALCNEANEQLQSELERFQVNMTHMGNSYYRYDDQYYLVSTNKITLIYSIKKGVNGISVLRNAAYDKVAGGNILLSPYTMWQIQLEPMHIQTNFTQLKSVIENGIKNFDLQMELIGSGMFVKKGFGSTLKLDYYYENDESIENWDTGRKK